MSNTRLFHSYLFLQISHISEVESDNFQYSHEDETRKEQYLVDGGETIELESQHHHVRTGPEGEEVGVEIKGDLEIRPGCTTRVMELPITFCKYLDIFLSSFYYYQSKG